MGANWTLNGSKRPRAIMERETRKQPGNGAPKEVRVRAAASNSARAFKGATVEAVSGLKLSGQVQRSARLAFLTEATLHFT